MVKRESETSDLPNSARFLVTKNHSLPVSTPIAQDKNFGNIVSVPSWTCTMDMSRKLCEKAELFCNRSESELSLTGTETRRG